MWSAECGMSVEGRARGSKLHCNSAFHTPHSAFCCLRCWPAAPRPRWIRRAVGEPSTPPTSASTSGPRIATWRCWKPARRSARTPSSPASCTRRAVSWISPWATTSMRRTGSPRFFPRAASRFSPRRPRATTASCSSTAGCVSSRRTSSRTSFTSTARGGSGARCNTCSAALPDCSPTSISRAGRSRDSRRTTSQNSRTVAGCGAASTRRCSPRIARPAPRARRGTPCCSRAGPTASSRMRTAAASCIRWPASRETRWCRAWSRRRRAS